MIQKRCPENLFPAPELIILQLPFQLHSMDEGQIQPDAKEWPNLSLLGVPRASVAPPEVIKLQSQFAEGQGIIILPLQMMWYGQ